MTIKRIMLMALVVVIIFVNTIGFADYLGKVERYSEGIVEGFITNKDFPISVVALCIESFLNVYMNDNEVKGGLNIKDIMDRRIAFNITDTIQSYNSVESVVVKEEKEKVIVIITKEFSTPGYSLGVEKILEVDGGYKVFLDIIPPHAESILPQVITYKTITIEINKSQLNGVAPYKFTVEGIKANLFKK